jgi:hypothetical protein
MMDNIVESKKRYDAINNEWVIQTRILYPDGTSEVEQFRCDASADPDRVASEHAQTMQDKHKDHSEKAQNGSGEGEGGEDEQEEQSEDSEGSESDSKDEQEPEPEGFWEALKMKWDAQYGEAIQAANKE